MDLNELDADLLNAVQWSFPLTATPFADLATRLERTEDEVIGALRAAKDAGVLRQLSAIFDTRALGYSSALIAAKVDPDRIDAAAEVINAPPRASATTTSATTRTTSGTRWPCRRVRTSTPTSTSCTARRARPSPASCPTLKLYKIGVKLDMTGKTAANAKAEVLDHEKPERRPDMEAPVLSDREVAAIRIAQEDLPLVPRPVRGAGREDRRSPRTSCSPSSTPSSSASSCAASPR